MQYRLQDAVQCSLSLKLITLLMIEIPHRVLLSTLLILNFYMAEEQKRRQSSEFSIQKSHSLNKNSSVLDRLSTSVKANFNLTLIRNTYNS